MSQYQGFRDWIPPVGKIKETGTRVDGSKRAAGMPGSTAPAARESAPPSVQTRSKYGAQPTVVDGIRFASKREATRYGELSLMQTVGEIAGLVLQPAFDLHVNGVRVCKYVADFTYQRGEAVVVEDAKGVKTAVYKLKKRMVEAEYGITVVEV